MIILTIPYELVKERELVLVPRKRFEELIRLAKSKVATMMISPKKTNYDLLALKKLEEDAIKEYKEGKTRSVSTSEELDAYFEEIRKDALNYDNNRVKRKI